MLSCVRKKVFVLSYYTQKHWSNYSLIFFLICRYNSNYYSYPTRINRRLFQTVSGWVRQSGYKWRESFGKYIQASVWRAARDDTTMESAGRGSGRALDVTITAVNRQQRTAVRQWELRAHLSTTPLSAVLRSLQSLTLVWCSQFVTSPLSLVSLLSLSWLRVLTGKPIQTSGVYSTVTSVHSLVW